MTIQLRTTFHVDLVDDEDGTTVTEIPVTRRLIEALQDYLHAVDNCDVGGESYSEIEMPVLEIGWAVLETFGLFPPRTQGRPPSDEAPTKGLIVRRGISMMRRARILARDGLKCLLCGATANLAIDHKVPISKGGSDEDDNLQTLCRSCNSVKGDRLDA